MDVENALAGGFLPQTSPAIKCRVRVWNPEYQDSKRIAIEESAG